MFESLSNRTTSSFGISVGTGLALESLFVPTGPRIDDTRVPPELLTLSKYDNVMINLKTLCRNIVNASGSTPIQSINPVTLMNTLYQEVTTINQLITEDNSKTKPIYYIAQHTGLYSKTAYPLGNIRGDTTDKQKTYTAITTDAIKEFLKVFQNEINFELFDIDISSNALLPGVKTDNTLIITHYPLDLTSYKNFGNLDLLESHTGAVKNKTQWYTKYLDGKELYNIPFKRGFLQIFGDKETFSPLKRTLRTELQDLAKKFNWTQTTTTDKIMFNIGMMPNHFFKDHARLLFKND